MAQATVSLATENTLENQRIEEPADSGRRFCVHGAGAGLRIGHDMNRRFGMVGAIADPTERGTCARRRSRSRFCRSSVGILVGALASGPIGDRFGRKPLLRLVSSSRSSASPISSSSAFAGSLGVPPAQSCASSPESASEARFSGTAASPTGDYTLQRWRAADDQLASFTGAPAGRFSRRRQLVALLLPHFGWPMIFILGTGRTALVLVVAAGGLAARVAAVPRWRASNPLAARGRRCSVASSLRPGAGA